ncbi:MAG: CHAT domain-containing protein [Bacteroidota bacterium]
MKSAPLAFICFFFLLPFSCFAQDWKGNYEKAIQEYQSQNFPEAMKSASAALEISRSMDAKNQAFSLQLLTVICIEAGDFRTGLPFSEEEVKLFATSEGTKSKRYTEAIDKRARINQALSNWAAAQVDYKELSDLLAAEGGIPYFKALSSYGQVLLALNSNDLAKKNLEVAVNGLKLFPEENEEYLYALYYAGNACSKSSDNAGAEERLKLFISLVEKNKLQSWPEYTEARTQLIQLLDRGGDSAGALKLAGQGSVGEEQKARQYLKAALDSQNEQPAKARDFFKLAEESLEKGHWESSTGFSVAQSYARFLLANKEYQASTEELAKAKSIAEKIFKPGSVESGYVMELEADLKMAKGNVDGALEDFILSFKNFSSLSSDVRATHQISASAKFLNANRPDLAKKLIEPFATDYTLLSQLSEKNQLEVSSIYVNALLGLNQTEAGIQHLTRHEGLSTIPALQVALSRKLAEVYSDAGDWKKAEDLLKKAVEKTPAQALQWAESNYQLARLLQRMGKFSEAETRYKQAIETFSKLKSPEINQALNSLATFYITLGNYLEAEKIYQNLLLTPGTSSLLVADAKQNLAAAYLQTHQYAKAEKLLTEVLEHDRQSIGATHPDFAISLQNLAAVYQAQGDFKKAETLYIQSIEIDKANGKTQTVSHAGKEANLGTIYQEMNEPEKARIHLESALQLHEKLLGQDHPDYIYNLYNVSVLYQAMGNVNAAAPLFKKVSAFYLGQINEIFPSLTDFEKTAYLNKIQRVINDYEEFIILYQRNNNEAAGDLFNFRLETKALLLNASTAVRERILGSNNSELLSKFTEWLQLKERLAQAALLGVEEKKIQSKVQEEFHQKANDLEKWLTSQSELFGKEFSKKPVTWQEIKDKLKPGEAAVEIIRLSPEKDSVVYSALIITPEMAAPALIVLKGGITLESREFSYYSNTIRHEITNTRSYAQFWKPFDKYLSKSSIIFFSADGVYNKINPVTLFDPETNQYLIERLTIRSLSNLRELISVPEDFSSAPRAVLFGSPNFQSARTAVGSHAGNSSIEEIIGNGIPNLPGTKEEVLSIESLLRKNSWGVNSYLENEATESRVKGIQSPDILHIATHGFFTPEKTDDSPLVYSTSHALNFDNPLMRSGLLLAGIENKTAGGSAVKGQSSQEDGILTALEVMNLNLENTKLVVLSACETGSGAIRNGEGVYGLQRAFIISGATNLIMSLWKVSDEATQKLMTGFYENLITTNERGLAFRKAQLELKKLYPTPFYWGGFILIGR